MESNNEKLIKSQAESLASKTGVTNQATQGNLRRYCKVVGGLINAARLDTTGKAMQKIRDNICDNLPKDFNDQFKAGKTMDEVRKFYWIEEFVKIWYAMGLNKTFYDALVETEYKNVVKQ